MHERRARAGVLELKTFSKKPVLISLMSTLSSTKRSQCSCLQIGRKEQEERQIVRVVFLFSVGLSFIVGTRIQGRVIVFATCATPRSQLPSLARTFFPLSPDFLRVIVQCRPPTGNYDSFSLTHPLQIQKNHIQNLKRMNHLQNNFSPHFFLHTPSTQSGKPRSPLDKMKLSLSCL